MFKHCHILFLAILLNTSKSGVAQTLYKVTTGNILFKSDAPLEMIKANSAELKGLFVPEKKQFAFKVKVTSFKGFNGPLQREHFNENYLETNLYPDAAFEGKVIEDIDVNTNGTIIIRTKGNLTIHGVTQERIIKSELTIKGKTIFIKAEFSVQLEDHHINIPKVVHEKLASEIKVEIKAEMNAQ